MQEEVDCVILTNDPVPKEIGVQKIAKKKLMSTIPFSKMGDDESIIDFFLENQHKL